MTKIIYCAITSHGFGHIVRSCAVLDQIKKLDPSITLIVATTAPRWLLDSYLSGDFIQRNRSFDIGVIQSDSLQMDKLATLKKLQEIRKKQDQIIRSEVEYLTTNKVDLILADVPPLVANMAKKADIPCFMMSNFGWDFIYHSWGGDFTEIAEWMSQSYQLATRTFQLPLSEAMTSFNNKEKVGLTGGNLRFTEKELRKTLSITVDQEKLILLSFGGLGLQKIPYETVNQFPDYQFLTFDKLAPNLPNLIKIEDIRYRPVDFLPWCGRVVSKPGYSTFAEVLRYDIPLVTLTRDDFAEAELLLTGLQDYGHHQILSPDPFFKGNWDFLREKPTPPRSPHSLSKNGTESIAHAVLSSLS